MSYEAPICDLELMPNAVNASKEPPLPGRWESDIDSN